MRGRGRHMRDRGRDECKEVGREGGDSTIAFFTTNLPCVIINEAHIIMAFTKRKSFGCPQI